MHLHMQVVGGIAYVFGRVVSKYRPTAAESKRLVTVLHGPVVSHLLELLDGREYLRAFGQVQELAPRALSNDNKSTDPKPNKTPRPDTPPIRPLPI